MMRRTLTPLRSSYRDGWYRKQRNFLYRIHDSNQNRQRITSTSLPLCCTFSSHPSPYNPLSSSSTNTSFTSPPYFLCPSRSQTQTQPQPQWVRYKSTCANDGFGDSATLDSSCNHTKSIGNSSNSNNNKSSQDEISTLELSRLKHLRNVGIFAHVDAGKTTVTERMLALAGIVTRAGNVDDGNTVTDYLPAERERGITIQSAAITFPWAFHNADAGESMANDRVSISLIDTPGHIDFSVEVNRSVAVLDGAVLVVDAAAGVQAQTQTVWRALTRPSLNNHDNNGNKPIHEQLSQDHAHEPLPCLAVINKMDKVGSDFFKAVQSLKTKLYGANPVPIQLPLFRNNRQINSSSESEGLAADPNHILSNLIAADSRQDNTVQSEDFCGILDLVHMRAVIWPNSASHDMVENIIPTVVPLLTDNHELLYPDCPVTQAAVEGRFELIESLAEVDDSVEEMYLNEEDPSNADLRRAIRKATLDRLILPVLASAAVQGKGIEPCLDAIADFLPSPIDRSPPALTLSDNKRGDATSELPAVTNKSVALGHCFHPSLLALAFKVVHMKGRGGSGDGRVVFARIYSGKLKVRDSIQIITPPTLGETVKPPRVEKVGGMLEMAGGEFNHLEQGIARSGDVCALVGLKSVVTGDTILIGPEKGKKGKASTSRYQHAFCAGVAAPKPVLKVKVEAESSTELRRLTEVLQLFTVEDPSLLVEETEAHTLLSGLGELHIEITLDRLRREHNLNLLVGPPAVSYRESTTKSLETDGMVNFERSIGENHLQASIHLCLEPVLREDCEATCHILADPVITISDKVRSFFGHEEFEGTDDELEAHSDLVKTLFQGCRGALKRGPNGYAMANIKCHIIDVDADGGLPSIIAMPGALRAAAAHTIQMLTKENKTGICGMEPIMSIELSVPNDLVGAVLSDLTGRRGHIVDVFLGDSAGAESKALVRGEVPLIEILGYANILRSLTGGEASFTSEYKGHAPCKL